MLTPLEATRIRLVSQRGYASGLTTGFMRLAREGGIGELYAGFLPILCKCVMFLNLSQLRLTRMTTCRQIPYAIGQFAVNEYCHEIIFRSMSDSRRKSVQASSSAMFVVNLGSGVVAGAAAAVLSQVRSALSSFRYHSSPRLTAAARRHPPQPDQQRTRTNWLNGDPTYRPSTRGWLPRAVCWVGAKDCDDCGLGFWAVLDLWGDSTRSVIFLCFGDMYGKFMLSPIALGAPPGIEIHKSSE